MNRTLKNKCLLPVIVATWTAVAGILAPAGSAMGRGSADITSEIYARTDSNGNPIINQDGSVQVGFVGKIIPCDRKKGKETQFNVRALSEGTSVTPDGDIIEQQDNSSTNQRKVNPYRALATKTLGIPDDAQNDAFEKAKKEDIKSLKHNMELLNQRQETNKILGNMGIAPDRPSNASKTNEGEKQQNNYGN